MERPRHERLVSRLRVAIVAPTLEILGGHSVQAAALLAGWRHDAEVEAWLVPINPRAAGVAGAARRACATCGRW